MYYILYSVFQVLMAKLCILSKYCKIDCSTRFIAINTPYFYKSHDFRFLSIINKYLKTRTSYYHHYYAINAITHYRNLTTRNCNSSVNERSFRIKKTPFNNTRWHIYRDLYTEIALILICNFKRRITLLVSVRMFSEIYVGG